MAKPKFVLIITADCNDADYVTSVSTISADDVKKLKPLFQAIKKFKPYKGMAQPAWEGDKPRPHSHFHNWPSGEAQREDLGEKSPEEIYANIPAEVVRMFEDLCPTAEYGFHTIYSVELLEVASKKKLI